MGIETWGIKREERISSRVVRETVGAGGSIEYETDIGKNSRVQSRKSSGGGSRF